jgi:hypothetical protein
MGRVIEVEVDHWGACSTDVEVRRVLREGEEWSQPEGQYERLEVHYLPGTRSPRVGERLGTWVDVSTRYALAPREVD